MSIDSTWLRCPNCFQALSSTSDGVLGCDSGHRFDVSKHGTITLLPPHAPRTIGDSREMLDARARLLETGLFAPISDAVVSVAQAEKRPDRRLRVADLGCGTGYYAGRFAEAYPSATFLTADRSPIAVRIATRAVPNSTGIVLDLWRPLPLRDAIADVILNVFAPRNPTEFARVLRPGGVLVVVVPTTEHLRELRTADRMLEVPAGKVEQVSRQLASAGLARRRAVRVERRFAVSAGQRDALLGMGPSAHHRAGASGSELDADHNRSAHVDVAVSVDVLAFRR